jgi:phosphinothricin acetyltransferase
MAATIRIATGDDAAGVAAIYAPIVADTAISFEVEPPSAAEMRRRIHETLTRCPWLVCERDGAVLGYVYASPHHARAAYRWSVDVTVYIHERARRCGVGRALYTALFRLLVKQGFYNAYAGVTLPNPPSVGLHEALGFTPIGVYRHVGWKFGAWHDVGWWALALQAPSPAPAEPIDFPALRSSPDCAAALQSGAAFLRG